MQNGSLMTELYQKSFARQWISPAMRDFISFMEAEGVHAEQLYLGFGLLTLEQYAEAVSEVTGCPFMHLCDVPVVEGSPFSELVCERERCCPLWQEEQVWHVGFVDPSVVADASAWKERHAELSDVEMKPYVILLSEWNARRVQSDTPPSIHRMSDGVRAQLDAQGLHHVRLQPSAQEVTVSHAGGEASDIRLPSWAMNALALHLSRREMSSGWEVETHPALHGHAIHLTRQEPHADAPHPVEWMDAVEAFLQQPQGLLLLITDDAYATQRLQRLCSSLVGSPVASCMFSSSQDVEEALHGLLLGESRLACLAPARAQSWVKPEAVERMMQEWMAPSEIPLRVIRSRATSHGMAWEVLST